MPNSYIRHGGSQGRGSNFSYVLSQRSMIQTEIARENDEKLRAINSAIIFAFKELGVNTRMINKIKTHVLRNEADELANNYPFAIAFYKNYKDILGAERINRKTAHKIYGALHFYDLHDDASELLKGKDINSQIKKQIEGIDDARINLILKMLVDLDQYGSDLPLYKKTKLGHLGLAQSARLSEIRHVLIIEEKLGKIIDNNETMAYIIDALGGLGKARQASIEQIKVLLALNEKKIENVLNNVNKGQTEIEKKLHHIFNRYREETMAYIINALGGLGAAQQASVEQIETVIGSTTDVIQGVLANVIMGQKADENTGAERPKTTSIAEKIFFDLSKLSAEDIKEALDYTQAIENEITVTPKIVRALRKLDFEKIGKLMAKQETQPDANEAEDSNTAAAKKIHGELEKLINESKIQTNNMGQAVQEVAEKILGALRVPTIPRPVVTDTSRANELKENQKIFSTAEIIYKALHPVIKFAESDFAECASHYIKYFYRTDTSGVPASAKAEFIRALDKIHFWDNNIPIEDQLMDSLTTEVKDELRKIADKNRENQQEIYNNNNFTSPVSFLLVSEEYKEKMAKLLEMFCCLKFEVSDGAVIYSGPTAALRDNVGELLSIDEQKQIFSTAFLEIFTTEKHQNLPNIADIVKRAGANPNVKIDKNHVAFPISSSILLNIHSVEYTEQILKIDPSWQKNMLKANNNISVEGLAELIKLSYETDNFDHRVDIIGLQRQIVIGTENGGDGKPLWKDAQVAASDYKIEPGNIDIKKKIYINFLVQFAPNLIKQHFKRNEIEQNGESPIKTQALSIDVLGKYNINQLEELVSLIYMCIKFPLVKDKMDIHISEITETKEQSRQLLQFLRDWDSKHNENEHEAGRTLLNEVKKMGLKPTIGGKTFLIEDVNLENIKNLREQLKSANTDFRQTITYNVVKLLSLVDEWEKIPFKTDPKLERTLGTLDVMRIEIDGIADKYESWLEGDEQDLLNYVTNLKLKYTNGLISNFSNYMTDSDMLERYFRTVVHKGPKHPASLKWLDQQSLNYISEMELEENFNNVFASGIDVPSEAGQPQDSDEDYFKFDYKYFEKQVSLSDDDADLNVVKALIKRKSVLTELVELKNNYPNLLTPAIWDSVVKTCLLEKTKLRTQTGAKIMFDQIKDVVTQSTGMSNELIIERLKKMALTSAAGATVNKQARSKKRENRAIASFKAKLGGMKFDDNSTKNRSDSKPFSAT